MHKENRLTLRRDFSLTYRFGRSVANHQFVLFQKPRKDQGPFRLGISASKKIGNAVVRNRVRRLIKEIVRLSKGEIKQGIDIIIVVRKPAADMDFHLMEKSLKHLFRRAGLYANQPKGD